MILKKRASRIIAFAVSCALMGICAFQGAFIVNDNISESYDRRHRDDVMGSDGYIDDMNSLYDQLWAISDIYLRYTDKNGKFTGSEFFKKSAKQALLDLKLIDINNRPIINNPRNFEYYASCGDNFISNTTSPPEELASDHSIEIVNGNLENYCRGIHFPSGEGWWYYREHGRTETNYGMTYFFTGGCLPRNGVAIYDFDTAELESYTDRNGVEIFYKTDGSTPVPDSRYLGSDNVSPANREAYEQFDHEDDIVTTTAADEGYNSNTETALPEENYDNIITEAAEPLTQSYDTNDDSFFDGDISEVTDTGVYMFFDSSSNSWFKVNKNKFIETDGDESDITIYIKPSDDLIAEYEQYNEHLAQMEADSVHKAIALIPVAAAGALIALVLLVCCGYSTRYKKFALSMPDHIFGELPALLIIGSLISVFAFIEADLWNITNTLRKYYDFDMAGIIEGSALTALYAICLGCLITLVTRLKCRSFWKTTLTGRIIAFLWRSGKKLLSGMRKRLSAYFRKKLDRHRSRKFDRNVLRQDIFMRRFLIRTAIAMGAGLLVTMFAIASQQYESLVLFYILILAAYLWLSIRDHAEISAVAKQIADMNGGDYSPRAVEEKSPAYGMTNNLNNISNGIRSAVDKQVKSERMKIELVTNVSHDLKTPLTSIISYIDLLSNEEMCPAARDYVSILNQKSDRLKAMVSDLFDLAKATSCTDLTSEQLDAVILVQQVLGDMADKIGQSGRDVRTVIEAQSAPVMGDGKKLYRVLQNLIDNALKYSMNGTRIYVTLETDGISAHISCKNISAEEMSFTPEEIMERFTRGDRSRTTEGNGLGLSIAKSFTEACGGSFDVVIDGDMFTAHVKLPLIK